VLRFDLQLIRHYATVSLMIFEMKTAFDIRLQWQFRKKFFSKGVPLSGLNTKSRGKSMQ